MFGLRERLFAIQDESSTSLTTDIAELGAEEELKVDNPNEEVEEEEETLPPDEEERPEETEEEEESEEEKAPEIKDLHPFDRPSIKQITEEFPDLFKKFPSLRDMYFREAEYSKTFPTIEDAKEAAANSEAFSEAREDIFSGDGTKLFSAIKEVNEKGLEKFAGHFFNSIFKVSPNAFWRASNPLVESIATNMFNKGVKDKDENMQNAARYLSEYFFGSTEIAEGKKTTIIKEEEGKSEVAKEREAFDNEKGIAFYNTTSELIKTNLLSLIDSKDLKGKSRLDPDEILSPFIKQTIIDRVADDVGKQLTADKDHINFMNSLWQRAKRNGRTDEDKARIVSAYLARAKSLIPSLRSKYVSEALGKKIKSSDQRRERVSEIESRRDSGSSGRSSVSKSTNYNPKSIDYRKTSDEDILNDQIQYKN